jgi:hypothetical protein
MSPVESPSRRVVRPVDLTMAVQAPFAELKLAGRTAGQSVSTEEIAHMTGSGMTCLAEIRNLYLQEGREVRPVGLVTVGATFPHRCMLPEQGTPFLCVAAVTRFIHRGGLEQRGPRPSVGIVAARARELSLAEGHVGRSHELRATLFMALRAGVQGILRDQEGLVRSPLRQVVAIAAPHPDHLMATPSPVHPHRALMALQTHGVSLLRRERTIRSEDHLVRSPRRVDMLAERAMAGFTVSLLQVVLRIGAEDLAVLGLLEFSNIVFVTSLANLDVQDVRRVGHLRLQLNPIRRVDRLPSPGRQNDGSGHDHQHREQLRPTSRPVGRSWLSHFYALSHWPLT